jgi:hypothetical protein
MKNSKLNGETVYCSYGEWEQKVEYISADEKCSIPKLIFSYQKHELFIVDGPGLDNIPEEDQKWFEPTYDKTGMCAYRKEVEFTHITLMNFRRYSWSWAPGYDAEYGYGHGVAWVNLLDGGISCSTPEQVIRESFIRTLAELERKHEGLNMLIRNSQVKALLNRLVQEALSNSLCIESASRALGSYNGCCSKVDLLVDGTVLDIPEISGWGAYEQRALWVEGQITE